MLSSQAQSPSHNGSEDLQNLPSVSTKAAPALKRLIAESEVLLSMRATLVHSTMQLGSRDGETAALFHNVISAVTKNGHYLVMTEGDFGRTGKQLQSLADKARTLLP
jgi:hypothetical protein